MRFILRPALCLSLVGLAACDELAVANDPEALSDLRGEKSCIRAVNSQTGASNASINTTIPVIETNYYIVDVPGAKSWNCVTNEQGAAVQIVQRR